MEVDVGEMMLGEECGILRKLIKDCAKKGLLALEIGTWKGCSTQILAEEISKMGGLLFCIDDWLGNGNKDTEDKANQEDVFYIFRNNMKLLNLWEYIKVLMMPSDIANIIVADEVFDFIFLDADHSYEHVKQDIQMWLPTLKAGGIFCGHDIDHEGVVGAVKEIRSDYYQQEERIWYFTKEGKSSA